MASELRRSFKEKAKETFGFTRLGRRSDGEAPPVPDDNPTPPSSAPPILPSSPIATDNKDAMATSVTMATRPSTIIKADSDPTDGPDKRRSRHLVQPKGTIMYEVSGHDSLPSIAAQFDTTTSELKKVNKLMTTMVFPGQVLYVPDKDYVPSESSTPTSPTLLSPLASPAKVKVTSDPAQNGATSPQHKDSRAAFDLKLTRRPKVPGHAERQPSTSEDPASPAHVPPSLDEVKKIDRDLSERFIKVLVKHITDGQGVVSGVLLVTPNAIMFDPNVSDPLVVDRGPEDYGMIAPMDTIISAAMYHDIAAMNQKNRVKTEDGVEPVEVYHDKSCALYKSRTPPIAVPDSVPIPGEDSTATSADGKSPIKRSESVCSCGALERDWSSLKDSGDTRLPTIHADAIVVTASSDATTRGFTHDQVVPKDTDNKPTVAMVIDQESSKPADLDSSVDQSDAVVPSSSSTLAPQLPVQYFSGDMDRRTPSPQQDGISVPRDSGGSPKPSSSPKDHGLLSRTLESLSSLGSSFPGSPNLTNLTTGLFSWNQDGVTTTTGEPVSAASLLRDRSMEEVFATEEEEEQKRIAEEKRITEEPQPKTQKILDLDVEVENLVKMHDKPDLFKDLDETKSTDEETKKVTKKKELVPRPAAHYEDPPLYLCLRIGLPSNKRVSKTCPIESYMKHKLKPEYWFCIPRDKVDQLYAFFLQWSPSIYGSDEEMSLREQGFVVVTDTVTDDDDDATTADMELVDNHFLDKMTPHARGMTKDWEIVNLEEARRRLSVAEVENLPLPELSDTSCILNDVYMKRLCLHLPARAEGYPWTLIYSSEKHGFSLKTLYRTMHKMDCPILLVIRDTSGEVFGAMLPCAIVMSDHFYGTGESFLFSFYPDFKRFGWSGINNFFIKGNAESLSIGSSQGAFGLWLDGDLYHGRTEPCQTYNNDLLTSTEDFVVKGLEAWGFL